MLHSVNRGCSSRLLCSSNVSSSSCYRRTKSLLLGIVRRPGAARTRGVRVLRNLHRVTRVSVFHRCSLCSMSRLVVRVGLSVRPTRGTLRLVSRLLRMEGKAYSVCRLIVHGIGLLLRRGRRRGTSSAVHRCLCLARVQEVRISGLVTHYRCSRTVYLLGSKVRVTRERVRSNALNR